MQGHWTLQQPMSLQNREQRRTKKNGGAKAAEKTKAREQNPADNPKSTEQKKPLGQVSSPEEVFLCK